ncbi:hypothetical protein SDC9_195830 [bioreactor metagenome]|uniref:Uncharacterized protein n=1 Tax=bioreactor metagenome TaxID=1076179 RepID=A0A645IA51_9ZZZZ
MGSQIAFPVHHRDSEFTKMISIITHNMFHTVGAGRAVEVPQHLPVEFRKIKSVRETHRLPRRPYLSGMIAPEIFIYVSIHHHGSFPTFIGILAVRRYGSRKG